MPNNLPKTETLNMRIDSVLKETLQKVADQEVRSLTNMVEIMIIEYCSARNIKIEWRKG